MSLTSKGSAEEMGHKILLLLTMQRQSGASVAGLDIQTKQIHALCDDILAKDLHMMAYSSESSL